MHVLILTPEQWKENGEWAHAVCFNEFRDKELDRISFAMLVVDEKKPVSYCTVRELDRDSVYWQYGGAFPGTITTIGSFKSYMMMVNKIKEMGYKRISTYVENTNTVMIKMCIKAGYVIVGTRYYDGHIYVDFLNEFEDKE